MRVFVIVAASLLVCGGIIHAIRWKANQVIQSMREAMSDPKLWGD